MVHCLLLFVVRCSLSVVCCLLLDGVCRSLFAVRFQLCADARCLLFVVFWLSLFWCLLFVVRCVLFVICGALSGVCCLKCVVRC